jgi:hypothetical protein
MYHALLRADPARYFQAVMQAPLYLGGVTHNGRRLVTWERGGRTHLLAFTSPEGLARCVGTEADTVLTVTFPQLVAEWPDPGWWLALNPALPIDATLPVTDVVAAARGDLEIPMPVPSGLSGLPPLPALPALAAPSALSALSGLAGLAGGGPADSANELEEAMAEALAQGSVPLLLDLLVFAEVLLPTLRRVEGPPKLDDPDFPWCALPLSAGHPVDEQSIGVFTSPQRLAEATAGAAVPTVAVALIELAMAWPAPEYALLVNPESALRARLPGGQVAGLPEWARISAHYHGLFPG